MNHVINWTDIPAIDINRAKLFYSSVFGSVFIDDEMPGMKTAMFEAETGAVSGMLVEGEGYVPSATGTVVYFDGGKDLAEVLKRAEALGSEVVCPKTAIKDGEEGYFAQLIDSEGNRIGLYSQS